MKNQQEYLAAVVKNLPARAGDIRDGVSIPRLRRTCGQGNDNPLQYFCPKNAMDREAWWATVHRVTKNRTRWKCLSRHLAVNDSRSRKRPEIGIGENIQNRPHIRVHCER